MTVDEFERQVHQTATRFAYIRQAVTLDKTANTVKLRLQIAKDCFVQVYANTAKGLYNYVLVLSRQRFYGRDCEGGDWHRHPHHDADTHDVSPEGSRPVSPEEFLVEVEQVLTAEGIL